MKFSNVIALESKDATFKKLREYDEAYHIIGSPLVSDTEYDMLWATARDKYPDDEYFHSIGHSLPTEKVKLPYVLGSLNKLKINTIDKWLDKQNDIVISEKLDGASIVVTWKNGNVVFAATRGDGEEGQNITDKAKIFCPSIHTNDTVTLRGEVLLIGDDHITLGFKNKRNGVVGLINNDTPSLISLKMIHPVFYEYIDGPIEHRYEIERLDYIKHTLLLNTPNYELTDAADSDYLVDALFIHKENSDYDIDGLVLTVNDSVRENVMLPKNKISFKVNEDSIQTKVTGIEWNTTRMGKIIPVVLLEATEINGTTVRRATGFNAKFIKDNKIGTGAIVGIVKSGEIIPYITEVFEPSDINSVDSLFCPSCNGLAVWEGVDLVCVNKDCSKMAIKKITHFFKTLGSEYMSEKTIEKLNVTTIEDMYELNELNMIQIDGIGIKKAEQIVYETQKTLKTEPEKLLAAFGIDSIGNTLSKEIMKQFTMDELFDTIDINKLSFILGPKTKEKFLNKINEYSQLYTFLKMRGLKFKENGGGQMFEGKKFTLTGKAPLKRTLIVALIEKNGGTVASISKTTNYLITSDMDSQTGKMKNALEYGTKIMSYDELLSMMDE